jgi:CBS domain-containing protein
MTSRETPVSEVMQTEVVTLGRADRLDLAEDIMRLGRIRHMPVLDEGRVVGMLSSRDLLAASLSKVLEFDRQERRTFLRSVAVEEVMTPEPLCLAPGATLAEAAAILVHRKIGALPVVKPDRTLVGLVTETDLVRAAILDAEPAVAAPSESHPLASLEDALRQEIERVRQTRDELRVKLHLARAEARDGWAALERRYRQLEAKLESLARQTETPARDVSEALKLLAGELRDGYRKIRDAIS